MLFRLSHKSRSVVNGVWIRRSQSILSPSLTSHLLSYTLHARFGKSFFWNKEREEWEITERKKVTKRPAGIRTGDLSLTGRMLFRLSHKSWSVVNGVGIRLSQSILSPSLTSHLLSYTLHARFGKSFFWNKEREEWQIFLKICLSFYATHGTHAFFQDSGGDFRSLYIILFVLLRITIMMPP